MNTLRDEENLCNEECLKIIIKNVIQWRQGTFSENRKGLHCWQTWYTYHSFFEMLCFCYTNNCVIQTIEVKSDDNRENCDKK